jgi:hypothetical protein
MKYPVTFSDDLKYLAAYYGWNAEDKKEVRAAFTDSEPMVRYLTILAAAHRAGYSQGAGNGFQRLKDWCLERGLPDPYGTEFDIAALDKA